MVKKTQTSLWNEQDDVFLACKDDVHCSDDFVVPGDTRCLLQEEKKCLSKMGIWE